MAQDNDKTIQEEEELTFTKENSLEHEKTIVKDIPCNTTKEQKRKKKTITKTLTLRIKKTTQQ